MADVYDRWHRSRPDPGGQLCKHDKRPTAEHGVGQRWQVRYRDPNGKQKKENFARKPDADRRADALGGDLVRGVYLDPKAGRITLRRYADEQWLPAQVHLRPSSSKLYRSHLNKHIYPVVGDRQIAGVSKADLKAFVSSLSKGLAPITVVTIFSVLRALMNSAVDDGLIPANPCSRISLPRIEPAVLEPLTATQVTAVAAAMTPWYRIAIWLAAGAGLREGEVFGLLVERVLFLHRKIMVEEQAQSGLLGPPKTRASKAAVPVDDLVLEKLAEHLKDYPPRSTQLVDGRTVELVMTNRFGRVTGPNPFGECWRLAVKKAGLPKGTRFHDLRHFYASTLIAAGLHPKVIQSRLRHATLAETMDTYGHLFPDHEEHGRGALDKAFQQVQQDPDQGTPRAQRA